MCNTSLNPGRYRLWFEWAISRRSSRPYRWAQASRTGRAYLRRKATWVENQFSRKRVVRELLRAVRSRRAERIVAVSYVCPPDSSRITGYPEVITRSRRGAPRGVARNDKRQYRRQFGDSSSSKFSMATGLPSLASTRTIRIVFPFRRSSWPSGPGRSSHLKYPFANLPTLAVRRGPAYPEIGAGWQVTIPVSLLVGFCLRERRSHATSGNKKARFLRSYNKRRTNPRWPQKRASTAAFAVFAFSPLLQSTLTISAEDRRDGRRETGKRP
jgi:hypothetical protein